VIRLARIGAVIAFALLAALPASAAPDATTSPELTQIRYPRCAALNKRYPHGVGMVGARDRTSGTPVTNFRRSNRLYRQNDHLDRDKDRIACEKA